MSAKIKPKLSKGILEMKFMQRTKVKVDKEIADAEGRSMYSNEITERMLNQSNSNFIMEPSFIRCEGLIEGRLSFRGMNPEIERLLELEQAELEQNVRHDQPTEVSVNEMAASAFYHQQQAPTASKAMQKKFQNKRKINNNSNENNAGKNSKDKKKGKFQKPKDSDDEGEE